MPAAIAVGTSSWADPGFVAEWYPPGLPARERLSWYAQHFDAVEVNSTFYGIPTESSVRRWAQLTPPGFTFDVKLHRLLSRHAAGPESLPPDLRDDARRAARGRVVLDRRLQDRVVEHTLAGLQPLVEAGKLSGLLLQMSPAFDPHGHRLDELGTLISSLAPHPVAVELRHRGWVSGERLHETLAWLTDHRAAWVGVDAPPGDQVTIMPPVDAVTRDGFAYLRAHGRNTEGYLKGRTVAERFGWRYTDDELRQIIARATELAEQAGDSGTVRLMFNNNRGGDAPAAAQRTLALLGERP